MTKTHSNGAVAVGHPVDVATGTLFHEFEDFVLPGRVPLIFGRRYSSALTDAVGGMFGPGWASPLEMRILQDLDGYRMVDADGETEIEFEDLDGEVDAGGTVRDPGSFSELRRDGDRLVVTRWNPEDYEVVRFIFPMGKAGEWWPLASREDPEGQGYDIHWDRAGRVRAVRLRREGRGFRLETDGRGRVSDVYLTRRVRENADGLEPLVERERRILRYEYDANGRLARFIDPEGHSSAYEYDSNGRMVRETNIGGMVYTFRYDEQGRCVETSGANDFGKNILEINEVARVTEVTDSLGNTTLYEWNESGQVTRTISPLGNVSATEYDDDGRIVARISPEGGATAFEYDGRGDRVAVTSPSGAVTRYVYNDDHQVVAVTDPAGHLWRREYDEFGRVSAVVNPLEERLSYFYGGRGDLLSMVDNGGNRRRFEWDEFGNLVLATDWLNHPTTYVYDEEGQLVALRDPLGNETAARLDALGRVVEIRLPDGATRRFHWDPYDQLTRYEDENGAVTRWGYEACGLLEKVSRPTGGRIAFAWSTEPGQLLAVTNERGEHYRFEYDADGRLVQETDFGGRETRYEYDKDGNVSAIRDAAGNRTEVTRNADGAVTQIEHDDGSKVQYEYDDRGLLIAADNGDCPVAREYDPVGRLVKEIQGAHEIRSVYDSLGNRSRRESSLGHETDFSWDANGQIAAISQAGHNPIRFQYDAAWNETARFVDGGVRISQQYDNRMRRTEQRVTGAPGGKPGAVSVDPGPVVERKYQYDPAGNLTDIADARWGRIAYRYDASGRIVGSRFAAGFEERFQYDAADNLVGRKKASGFIEDSGGRPPMLDRLDYGPGNLLVEADGARYEYDELGQLVRKIEGEKTTRFEWNRSGQLVGITLPDGDRWQYRYDAFSRRVEKRGPSEAVGFVWDGDVVLHEIRGNGSGDAEADIVHWEFEPDGFAPISKMEDGNSYYCVNDVAGNPRELVGEDGELVWAALFTTWGEVHEERVSKVDCPIRFQGQWFDAETGLHYNRFRYYNSKVGRFVSLDPIRLSNGSNDYFYSINTTGWIDPFGLTSNCPREKTPKTNPEEFESVKGSNAKKNKKTKEIWEFDRLHKNHFEVYKNKKKWDKGQRDRSVWDDGRLKEKF